VSQPWERLRNEPSKSFHAFTLYCDLGPGRSLAKLAEQFGETSVSLRRLEQLSSKWSWVSRAASFDDDQDRQKRELNDRDRRSMSERHARMAMLIQSATLDQTKKWLQRLQAAHEPIWTPDQVTRMLATSVQIERVARGEPSEIIRKENGEAAPEDYSKWSPEDFRSRMVELFRLAGKTEVEARMLASQLLGLDDGPSGRVQ
jgi:hypothetical protein